MGLLITLVLGFGITQLHFSAGQDTVLNPTDRVAIDNAQYQSLFGGQAILVMYSADRGRDISDLNSKANVVKFDQIDRALKKRPDLIDSVITPATLLDWSNRLLTSPDGNPLHSVGARAILAAVQNAPAGQARDARTKDAMVTLTRAGAIRPEDRVAGSRAWMEFLLHGNDGKVRPALAPFFPDNRHSFVIVQLKGNASLEEATAGSRLVQQTVTEHPLDGASATVGAAPLLLNELNDYLRGGILILGGIAVVVMALILLLLFDVRWRLLPLGVVVIGVIWAFGLAGYLGIPLSAVTIAGLPVLLGVGIDYAIQMHARIEEEVIINGSPHPIQETSRHLCPALLVVTFDAIFAFAALHFAKVPMIRTFGVLLAIGIAVICFASIVLPLAVLGNREYHSPTTGRDYRHGILGRTAVHLGRLPKWSAPLLASLSIGVFLAGVTVEHKVAVQTDPTQWVNQHSKVLRDMRKIETDTGPSSELSVYVKSADPFSPATIRFVSQFSRQALQRHPGQLLASASLVGTLDAFLDVRGGGDVLPRPQDVKGAYDAAPADLQRLLVNPSSGATNIVFLYGHGSLENQAVVLADIRHELRPPAGVRATPAGEAVVGVALMQNLTSNRIELTYLAILFVGLFLVFRLRSVLRSLLSLLPVLIAVGASSLIAVALDLKLSPMSAVGGPLVVAACTEFTSLMLMRYLEERRRGLGPREAVDVTAARNRPGVHRLGPHRHCGGGGDRHVLAAPAERLRRRRRSQPGDRAPQCTGRPAPPSRVGQPAAAGCRRICRRTPPSTWHPISIPTSSLAPPRDQVGRPPKTRMTHESQAFVHAETGRPSSDLRRVSLIARRAGDRAADRR